MGTTQHRHHDLTGPGLAEAARAVLTASGEQWTGLRAAVFGALAAHHRPASAYDIAASLSAERGKAVAANSVYRILDLFVRTNLARRVESANAYIANSHPGCRHDCLFLICTGCGKVAHADNDALAGAMRAFAAESGFAEARPIMEIEGRCAACAALKP